MYYVSNRTNVITRELTKYQINLWKTTGKAILKCQKLKNREHRVEKNLKKVEKTSNGKLKKKSDFKRTSWKLRIFLTLSRKLDSTSDIFPRTTKYTIPLLAIFSQHLQSRYPLFISVNYSVYISNLKETWQRGKDFGKDKCWWKDTESRI